MLQNPLSGVAETGTVVKLPIFALIARNAQGKMVVCRVAADSATEARALATKHSPVDVDWQGDDVEFRTVSHIAGDAPPPKTPFFEEWDG